MSDPQPFIDDAIRRVALPDDLRARLSPASLFADDELDRLLARVPVPPGLHESIRSSVGAQPTRFQNGALDLSRFSGSEASRAGSPLSPVPAVYRRSSVTSAARDLLSVLAALGLVVMLAVAGMRVSQHLEGPARDSRAVTRLDFTEAVQTTAVDWPLRLDIPDGPWGAAEHEGTSPPSHSVAALRDAELERPPTNAGTHDGVRPEAPRRPSSVTVVRGAAGSPDLASGLHAPPFMTTVDVPEVAHRPVPRVQGYDLAFEMSTGEQPFVDPSAHVALAVDRPPLSVGSDGFERLTAAHDSRRDPLRVEDILAAVSPPPSDAPGPQRINLHLHEVRGLRSLGDRRTVLLEVAATAGPPKRPSQPVHVTLVLDQAAAGEPSVWRRICRALAGLAGHMNAEDRVNVVLCGQRPRLILQAAGPRALSTLATDLEWQPAAVASDLESGLRMAPLADRVIVLAHASSLDGRGHRLGQALAEWQTALAAVGGDSLACRPAGGTRFIILDPAAPMDAEPGEPTFGRTASDTVSIRRALMRQVTGHDTLVARACHLEVRFDPRKVALYRLIGHRQSAVESLAEASDRGTDLHAGETVRAVYEIVPQSATAGPGLAAAALTWSGPHGGRQRLEARPNPSADDLGDGLPSPHGCELLLATGVGELASGSAHLRRRPALAATVDQLIDAWRRRGDVTALGDALARSHARPVRVTRTTW